MKRLTLLLAVSFLFSSLLVVRSSTPGATLEPMYTDSMRGIYSGWLFLKRGFDVYRIPMGQLAESQPQDTAHAHWPAHPFIYPPGALALYVPFGWAEYELGVPEPVVHRAAVLLCVLLAHLSIWVFVRELAAVSPSLTLLIGGIYAIVALQFALNGFHDAAYVAAAVLGCADARRGRDGRSLFWIGLGSFLHFRALYVLPVAAAEAVRFSRRAFRGGVERAESIAAGTGLALAAASGAAFLVTVGSLDDTDAMNLAMEEEFGWGGVVLLTALSVATAAFFFRRGEALSGGSVLWTAALTFVAPFSRAWHSLALYPLFALISDGARKREVLLLWVLAFGGIAFRYFPNLRFLARSLGGLLP